MKTFLYALQLLAGLGLLVGIVVVSVLANQGQQANPAVDNAAGTTQTVNSAIEEPQAGEIDFARQVLPILSDKLFLLLGSRPANKIEREACMALLDQMKQRYTESNDDALALLSIGEAPRDETLDTAEHAAWTKVAATVLASDVAIRLY